MSASAEDFVAAARSCLDKPYEFGATGPDSFDCSGLVLFAAKAAGWNDCPRNSAAQATAGREISRAELAAGDLVFFDFNAPPAKVQHVGIYLGGGKMVNAQSQSPAAVCEASIDSGYWSERILGFRRVFENGAVVAKTEVASAATLDVATPIPPKKEVAPPADVMM